MTRAASRPGLIYLPGLDGTGRLLHRQPRLFEQYEVRCVAYPQDRAQSYDELAGMAATALEAIGPGVVLAESFGGAVALTLALQRPELVARLVLVNTFAYFPQRLRIRLAAYCGRWLPQRPSHPATRGVRGWFFFAKDIPQPERDEWWDRTADVPMRAFGYRLALIARLDLRPQLASIRQPVLVISAPNDRVVAPRACRAVAAGLPYAQLLERDVGHAAMIHPSIDIAALLADSSYWPSTPATSMTEARSRPG